MAKTELTVIPEPDLWYKQFQVIKERNIGPVWQDPTAAQLRVMLAEVAELLKASPELEAYPWGEVLFGEECAEIHAWLKTAKDDDTLSNDTMLDAEE